MLSPLSAGHRGMNGCNLGSEKLCCFPRVTQRLAVVLVFPTVTQMPMKGAQVEDLLVLSLCQELGCLVSEQEASPYPHR